MKKIHVIFSLSALATSVLLLASISGEAASSSKQCRAAGLSNAECACQIALDTGSRRALQLYLRQYSHSDTACNALASTAVSVSGKTDDGSGKNLRYNPLGITSSSSGGSSSGGSSSGGSSSGGSSSGGSSSGGSSSGGSSGGGSSSGGSSSGGSSSGGSSGGDDDGDCHGKGGGNCGVGGGSSGGNGTGNEGHGHGPKK